MTMERIVEVTVHLANKVDGEDTFHYASQDLLPRRTQIYKFCHRLQLHTEFGRLGWTAISAMTLTEGNEDINGIRDFTSTAVLIPQATWVYIGLDCVDRSWIASHAGEWDPSTVVAIKNLLQALAHTDPAHADPYIPPDPTIWFPVIIKALVHSNTALSDAAFLILHRAAQFWFNDPTFWPIMQSESLWPSLRRVALERPQRLGSVFMEMGLHLSRMPHWRTIIFMDISTCIALVRRLEAEGVQYSIASESKDIFRRLARELWGVYANNRRPFDLWILSALANFWRNFDFTHHEYIRQLVPAIKQSLDAGLCLENPQLLEGFASAICLAATSANKTKQSFNLSQSSKDALGAAAAFLTNLAAEIRDAPAAATPEEQKGYWDELLKKKLDDVSALTDPLTGLADELEWLEEELIGLAGLEKFIGQPTSETLSGG
ncbi:hypothetical protein DFH06DRAFT_727147 [Mycena polygramma]|nr:hypothetical protein DFH06DRAFT_727147 [Mycena polygramma]